MNLRRYFFTLLVVLPLSSPLSAQETDEDDKFFLGFAGSAVFPYDPNPLAGLGLARLMGVAPRLVLKYNIRPGLSQAGFLVSLARSCASR